MAVSMDTFVLCLTLFVVLFLLYSYIQSRIKLTEQFYTDGFSEMETFRGFGYIDTILTHQQEDVYNISSRIQGQEHRQWTAPDAYLSIEHITVTNQMNKPNYNDEPPTYEEAMRIATLNSMSAEGSTPTVIVVAPKPSTQ